MANNLLAPSGYKALQKTRQQNIGKVADPFAPTSQNDIQSTVNKYSGMYGTPQTDPQIQASAQAALDPIIAAITKTINDRASSSARSITGNANSLAASLGAIDYGAPYAGATHDQAAVNAALQQSLSGAGNDLAQGLTSRLGVIDDPTVAAAGGAVSGYGGAAGTTQLAGGSANIGQLLAEAAAAKTYGLKQPGLAKMQGLQDVAGVNQQAVNDIGTGTTSILGQLPNLVQAMRSSNQGIRDNRAQSAAQIFETLTGQNVTKSGLSAGLQKTYDAANAAAAPMPDPSLSNSLHYLVDQYGNPIPGPDGKPQPTGPQPAGSKPKALTVTDRKKLVADLDTSYYGVPPKQQYDSKTSTWIDVPNTGTPALDYNAAVQNLMDSYGLSKQDAMKYANQRYKPGEDGRPKSGAQKKTAKAVATGVGVPKTTGPFAGVGSAPSKTPPLIVGPSPKRGQKDALRGPGA